MTKIRIEIEGGTLGLSTDGGVFVSPARPRSKALEAPVVVRRTLPWPEELAPGEYEYRYRVTNGSGKYKLKLYVAGEHEPRQVSEERDALHQRGNIWVFTVPSLADSGHP